MSPPPVPLHNTYGALFIGMVVANLLLGISMLQAYYYYAHQRDKWVIISLVTSVMLFDTIHQCFITRTVYLYVITHWGDLDALTILIPHLAVENFFNAFTTLFVQSFLTVRVWRLSQENIWLTGFISLFVLANFASIITFSSKELQLDSVFQLAAIKPLSLAVNILSAASDLMIALSLCVLLHRSRTGFRRSDTMINKLMLFAVNTGLLTSLCALSSFIAYMTAPNTYIYAAFYYCIGPLYTNSLLATLNAREMIRSGTISTTSDKATLALSEFPKTTTTASRQRTGASNISISINTTKEFVTDLTQVHEDDKVETSSSNGALTGYNEKSEIV